MTDALRINLCLAVVAICMLTIVYLMFVGGDDDDE